MLDLITDTPAKPDPCVPLFSLKGLRPGPRLVVSGPQNLMTTLADLFWDRPDLSNMRGWLLLRAEGQNPAFDLPDDVLTLESELASERFAYHRVLGRMTALGMISGRGVPVRWVA